MADKSQKTFSTGMKIVGTLIALSLILFIGGLIFSWWADEVKTPAYSGTSASESGRQNPGP